MRAVLLFSLMLLACRSAKGACHVPADQSAGWKRVALPEDAPSLAAPWDIEQFRSGEPALVWFEGSPAVIGGMHHAHGRVDYSFQFDSDNRRVLEVDFHRGLAGAKVDVIAYSGGAALPLLWEARQGGSRLRVGWEASGVYTVVVRVHNHLREPPLVSSYRSGAPLIVGAQRFGAAFREPRSLYYYHPGGRELTLCEAPERRLELRAAALSGPAPVTVTLPGLSPPPPPKAKRR
jgi:hypothetical protein